MPDSLNMDDQLEGVENTDAEATKSKRKKKKKAKKAKSAKSKPLPKVLMTWGIRLVVVSLVVFLEVKASFFIVKKFFVPKDSAASESIEIDASEDKPPAQETKKPDPVPAKTKVPESAQTPDSPSDRGKEQIQSASNAIPETIGGLFTLSDVLVNPALSNGKRFFVTSIVFAFKMAEHAELLGEREPILQDRIISYLSKKTSMWLSQFSNREVIRREFIRIAKEVTGCQDDVYMYFTKYVIQ